MIVGKRDPPRTKYTIKNKVNCENNIRKMHRKWLHLTSNIKMQPIQFYLSSIKKQTVSQTTVKVTLVIALWIYFCDLHYGSTLFRISTVES